MNILADKQKLLYEKNTDIVELKKLEAEFYDLYYKLRDADDKKWWSKLSLEQRQRIHFLILGIYKLKNRLGGFSYTLINDKRTETNKPIIFAITHVGKYDIEVVSEAIRTHYYLLSGDYEHIQGIIDAPFLGLNGVFYFNEKDKADRKRVSLDMINHLQNNGNLMYFIEGTWNMSPNLPMLPCYWGIVDIAIKGNATIVPVAAEQYDKHFVINIGENFDMSKYDCTTIGKSNGIDSLRDTLATLKWEIWEYMPMAKRSELVGDEWDKYKEERYKEWPYFNDEYIDGLVFKPKNVITNKEAFAHVKKLTPNRNNAFLFDKRIHD